VLSPTLARRERAQAGLRFINPSQTLGSSSARPVPTPHFGVGEFKCRAVRRELDLLVNRVERLRRTEKERLFVHELIDMLDMGGVEEGRDHPRLRGKRDLLPRRDLGVTQAHLVEGDTAPHRGEILNHASPLVAAERQAVEEQGSRDGAWWKENTAADMLALRMIRANGQ